MPKQLLTTFGLVLPLGLTVVILAATVYKVSHGLSDVTNFAIGAVV